MARVTMMMTGTQEAVADLQWHWGSAYLITGAAGLWIAQRRDDGRTLTATGPDSLRELIIEDYAARPVPRDDAPGELS
jgi:hypothetical protein